MSGTAAEVKPLLLALFAPALPDPEAGVLAALGPDGWAMLDAMAGQHRLRPWLHDRSTKADPAWPVPPDIAQGWRAAWEGGAIGALTAQAAIVRLAAAFADGGVRMVALKGAQLAFFDYPAAALRPMRDIDILVAQADLPAALDIMAGAGCIIPADRDAAIARALLEKHLDPIFFPAFRRHIELHHRISEPQQPRGPFLPTIPTAEILADAAPRDLGGQPVLYPSREHMLAHLVLHAAYNHRFDCGPLALADIALLAQGGGRGEKVDWAAFHALAKTRGYAAGASLVLALVEQHFGPLGNPAALSAVPADMLASAQSLMLQDFEARDQVKLAVEAAQGSGLSATVLVRLRDGLAQAGPEGRMRWLGRTALRSLRQSGNARARSEAREGTRLSQWLTRDDER